jgi:hypothetical protein
MFSLYYSQILPRPCLFLCPQRISAPPGDDLLRKRNSPYQSGVDQATRFLAKMLCEQRSGAIITEIYK